MQTENSNTQTLSETYNEDYYERGIEKGISLYENYRWLPELTIPFAFRIIEELRIRDDDLILDYGCAYGYLVKAFRLLYRQAWGVDISEYAISQADTYQLERCFVSRIKNIADLRYNQKFDFIISKDTLEHISYDEIDAVLFKLKNIGKRLFAIIPLGDGKKYILEKNERDITHHIKEDLCWWHKRFEKAGFDVERTAYYVAGMKEADRADGKSNQTYSNGFFFLRS